jgi:hypothetical protein
MSEPTPDLTEIRRALAHLFTPNQVVELRALEVKEGGRQGLTASGYFLDHEALAESAVRLGASAKGVYVTLNEVNPALLARAVNRLRMVRDREPLTSDGDIVRRRWLPIDCDPKRPAGISSTDEEHQLALDRVREIRAALRAEGWDEPIRGDSGNGAHLLYRIDQPAGDALFVKEFLAELARRFDDECVTVDQTVFNPARIWKLYGTVARKGDHAPIVGRPHRLARILEVPE